MNMFNSLKKNSEYQKVYKNGKSYANKYLIMYVLDNQLSCTRLGISVSKKVGNSVVRHRITRLVREVYRNNREQISSSSLDIVVVARVSAKGRSYEEIRSAFKHLCYMHKIVDKKNKEVANIETSN